MDLRRLGTLIHTWIYRASGGRLGAKADSRHMLLLRTRGRHSGSPRTTPLIQLPLEGGYLVVASNWGSEQPPAWWLNLQQEPRAEVQVGSQRIAVRAQQAQGEERARLLERAKAYNPHWKGYFETTQRQIPLVILRPI